MKYAVIALALFVAGCASTPAPVVITNVKTVAVQPDSRLSILPQAPNPVTLKELKAVDVNKRLEILTLKNVDLYGHIAILENQILDIFENIKVKAERIKKDEQK